MRKPWWPRLFTRRSRSARRARGPSLRPWAEALEDRALPALTALGPGGAVPYDLTAIGSTLYFATDTGIWSTDGTGPAQLLSPAAGTPGALYSPRELTDIGGQLYFVAYSTDSSLAAVIPPGFAGVQQAHIQLYRLNGQTPQVVQQLHDPGEPMFDGLVNLDSADPADLTDVGGKLFFVDHSDVPNNSGQGALGYFVQTTAPAMAGATTIHINPLPDPLPAGTPLDFQDANTIPISVVEAVLTAPADKGATSLTVAPLPQAVEQGVTANVYAFALNGGTVWGPTIIPDPPTGGFQMPARFYPYTKVAENSPLHEGMIYQSPVFSKPQNLIAVGNTVYFTALDSGPSGSGLSRLWVSDGGVVPVATAGNGTGGPQPTPGGTHIIDGAYQDPSNLTAVGNQLFFIASDPTHGRELWTVSGDGPASLVMDVNPGPGDAFTNVAGPSNVLVAFNGQLYFGADDGTHGTQLWQTGGTTVQPFMDSKGHTIPFTPGSDFLEVADGRLYFTSQGALWHTDGTPAGTAAYQLPTIPPAGSAYPGGPISLTELGPFQPVEGDPGQYELIKGGQVPFVELNGTLYFVASDLRHGGQVWKTDGTAIGTFMVTDLGAGSGVDGSAPFHLTAASGVGTQGAVFFTAADGANGRQVWAFTPPTTGPAAHNETATTDENLAATIDVLANDTGAAGTRLYVSSLGTPAHGTVTIDDSNNPAADPRQHDLLVYTPDPNFQGNDSFTCTVNDGWGHTATATVQVTVKPAVVTGFLVGQDVVNAPVGVAENGFVPPVSAGQAYGFGVAAVDRHAHVVTEYRGTVHFSSSDGAAVVRDVLSPATGDYTFTAADAGVHPFAVTWNTPGPQTLTVTDAANGSLRGRATAAVSFTVPSPVVRGSITSGPDNNLWFTDPGNNKLGRVTPAGEVEEFNLPMAKSIPVGITAGPDGNVWFTESDPSGQGHDANRIGTIAPGGKIAEFVLPSLDSGAAGITAGPDGNLWFVEASNSLAPDGMTVIPPRIGRITPDGKITEFPIPNPAGAGLSADYAPSEITAGPDGNLWFTEDVSNAAFSEFAGLIGRITPGGIIAEFTLPFHGDPQVPRDQVDSITAGPDGNLWFTEYYNDTIGRITPDGTITEFALPAPVRHPDQITVGPDGALWFTENGGLGRITPDGVYTPYLISPAPDAPTGVTLGPDKALWFLAGQVGRLDFTVPVQPGSSSPPAAQRLVLLGLPPTAAAGTTLSFTVTAEDASDHPATGYAGTVQFASTAGVVVQPPRYTFLPGDRGSHPFTVTFQTAGSPILGVHDTSDASISGLASVTVTASGGTTGPSGGGSPSSGAAASPGASASPPPASGGVTLSSLDRGFVIRAYVGLTHEPIAASLLAELAGALDVGASRLLTVRAIQQLPPYRATVVRETYGAILRRPPSAKELHDGVNYLAAGGTLQGLVAALFGLPEYFARRGGGSDLGFLLALYGDVFHGLPAPADQERYASLLAQGDSLADVAALALRSPDATRDEVLGLYRHFLHHRPDGRHLRLYAGMLEQGVPEQDVVARILALDAYFQQA